MTQILKGDGKAIFMVFVGTIIAIVFLASIADSVFNQSTTFTATNTTITAGGINVSVAILGRQLVDGNVPVTLNATNTSALTLVGEGVIVATKTVNGVRTVALTVNDSGVAWVGLPINVTYAYQPDGYLGSSTDRAIVGLVVLFGALGAMVFVVVVFMTNGSLGRLMGRKQ